jgi:phosphoserine phosphatase RsbU/P
MQRCNQPKRLEGIFMIFFLIDGDHLAVVIADVSGKGVPAALFFFKYEAKGAN